MADLIASIRSEFLRYKALAESAVNQMSDAELSVAHTPGSNSVAVICSHIAGNFKSRFSDFLTTDGEKPWRNREKEFEAHLVSREELLAKWEEGWRVLLDTLSTLADAQLHESVTIRGQSLRVHEALHRSLAHLAYHVGQIVYIAKAQRGTSWDYLSIPPGGSDAYNRNPTMERYPEPR